ncbi:MAG: ATP-dependent metallopeptidase FtsH/Yme1/Tma family protein, partial [Rikenellaceae bacterium]|nr:ATP-dependent metallopeptidase FtsH/Yme1/Tma family protein [Rikenellaceae bacterium]
MADNIKNPQKPGGLRPPRMSVMWIYILLGAVIIGWNLFSGSPSPKEVSWDTMKAQFLAKGDVQKIEVINRERAEVYLKSNRVEQIRAQKDYKDIPSEGPQLYFNIGSLDYFQAAFEESQAYTSEADRVPLSFKTRKSIWTDILLTTILPIGLLLGLWFFIMRGMSRGGGGGAGGGVFSVGKAKAQIFDKDTQVNVTFKDV